MARKAELAKIRELRENARSSDFSENDDEISGDEVTNMGLMQVKEHLRAEFSVNSRIQEERIDKVEQMLEAFSELGVLASNKSSAGGSLLDKISKYVINEGFAAKIRELRDEFLAKADFKLQSMHFVKTQELDD